MNKLQGSILLLSAAGYLGVAACADDFPTSHETTVTVEPAGEWPDTLIVGNDTTVEVLLTAGDGRNLQTRLVQWHAGNPAVVDIVSLPVTPGTISDSLALAIRARLRANSRGTASITIRIPGEGAITAVETTLTITVLERWIAVSAGSNYACGITSHHEAYCWGALGHGGALGNGSLAGSAEPTRVLNVLPNQSYHAISAGSGHTCALISTGGPTSPRLAYCWGRNQGGVLGSGTTSDELVPTLVGGGLAATEIGASALLSCANDKTFPFLRRYDDQLQSSTTCWGMGFPYPIQIGNPAEIDYDDGINFVLDTIAVGETTACGIWLQKAFCWSAGQYGFGAGIVDSILAFASVTVGRDHACALTPAGEAYCWGSNTFGQLGVAADLTGSNVPVKVNAPGIAFAAITAAGFGDTVSAEATSHTCALSTDSLAYCWGYNRNGFLNIGVGLGTSGPDICVTGLPCSAIPRRVASDQHFQAISTGGSSFGGTTMTTHACALTGQGQIHCWGADLEGQLGRGSGKRIAEPTN